MFPLHIPIFWPQDLSDEPKSHLWSQFDAYIPQGHLHRETGDTKEISSLVYILGSHLAET